MEFERLEYVNGLYADVMKANNKKQALENSLPAPTKKQRNTTSKTAIMIDGEGDLVVPDKKEETDHRATQTMDRNCSGHGLPFDSHPAYLVKEIEKNGKRAAESMRALGEFAHSTSIFL